MSNFNAIQYLGHSAIILKGDITIAIDPWLKGNPLCPAELQDPSKIDIIALSHGHDDHASDAVRIANKTGAKVLATYELAMLLIEAGIPAEQVLPMNKGGTINYNGVSISLSHAFHSSSFNTSSGTKYAGEAASIIVKTEKHCFFHAGDTALFSDLELIGKSNQIDFAFLPIGDCFTMNPREAALAAKMLNAPKAYPIHYKTFPLLTGTAEEFIGACRAYDIQAEELKIGENTAI